jgi:hypothetical protein
MNFLRVLLALAAAYGLLHPAVLPAAVVSPVMVIDTPSSFTMKVTRLDGSVVEAKAYLGMRKKRAEFTSNGMDLTVIARDDQNEMYGIFPIQHFIMQASIDDPILIRYSAFVSAFSAKGKFDRVGPETCEGFPCIRYNVTSDTGQLYYFWYDPARKVPVKVVAASGRFSLVIANFKRGPQPEEMFVVPQSDRHERYYTIPPFFPQPHAPAQPSAVLSGMPQAPR